MVPSKISDNTLKYVAQFRSKGRFPSLSYLHPNQSSITRSSQPLVGLKQHKSVQDEKLVEMIFNSHLIENSNEIAYNLIIDGISFISSAKCPFYFYYVCLARPTANAVAQTAMGAGFESLSSYKNCKLVFLGIENIHVVRDSYLRLVEAVSLSQFNGCSISSVDKSNWTRHIKSILEGAILMVQHVHQHNTHVLVHWYYF